MVVTPAEVCKIRMQAQFHSLLDPQEMARRKYRNVLQTAAVVAREEGIGALYKGLAPTVLRQGCNQVRVCDAAPPKASRTCWGARFFRLLFSHHSVLLNWEHDVVAGA